MYLKISMLTFPGFFLKEANLYKLHATYHFDLTCNIFTVNNFFSFIFSFEKVEPLVTN